MTYIAAGQADIGPEGGLLAPTYKQYARQGAPSRLTEQTMVYDLGALGLGQEDLQQIVAREREEQKKLRFIGPSVHPIAMAATAALAYHGYKRNDSIGWAIGWVIIGGLAPIIALPVAFAQGFGKPKGGKRKNPSTTKRTRRRIKSDFHKVYSKDGKHWWWRRTGGRSREFVRRHKMRTGWKVKASHSPSTVGKALPRMKKLPTKDEAQEAARKLRARGFFASVRRA